MLSFYCHYARLIQSHRITMTTYAYSSKKHIYLFAHQTVQYVIALRSELPSDAQHQWPILLNYLLSLIHSLSLSLIVSFVARFRHAWSLVAAL